MTVTCLPGGRYSPSGTERVARSGMVGGGRSHRMGYWYWWHGVSTGWACGACGARCARCGRWWCSGPPSGPAVAVVSGGPPTPRGSGPRLATRPAPGVPGHAHASQSPVMLLGPVSGQPDRWTRAAPTRAHAREK